MKVLKKERIHWVDNVKALGMILVFYGHFAERIAQHGASLAFFQFKFTHSFLMPLFFVMAGFFMSYPTDFFRNLRKLILRRLVPVIVFGLMLIPLWMIYFHYIAGNVEIYQIAVKTLYYFRGSPQLNLITWFLVCLFTSEVLASLLIIKLKVNPKNIIYGMAILITGLMICKYIEPISKITGISKNVWYLHEGIVALGFLFIGYAIFPYLLKLFKNFKWIVYIFLPLFLIITLLTFNLNIPFESFTVLMINSQHGAIIPFVITAFSGAIFIFCVCMLIPANKIFNYIGKNTLYLLGLNGIFHHFINPYIISWYVPNNDWLSVTLYCSFIVTCSFVLCYPLIKFLDLYFPQLFGKTTIDGPFIPNLEEKQWRDALSTRLRSWKFNPLSKTEENT